MTDDLFINSNEVQAYNNGGVPTFGGSAPAPAAGIVNAGQGRAVDVSAASKELAEMQSRIYLAKSFPRDEIAAQRKILNACQRTQLAAAAVYNYARGGTAIQGASIRLIEEVARHWGNILSGWEEVERRDGVSTVRTFAWDLESNVCKELQFVVPLRRTTKKGSYELTDERDIYELIANFSARRLRQCLQSLIPGDIVEAAVEQCNKTLSDKVNLTPERLKKMADAFADIGVTKAQIEKRIQRSFESMQPGQFVGLSNIYNSLKDGMSSVGDWFDEDEEKAALEALAKASEKTARKNYEEKYGGAK